MTWRSGFAAAAALCSALFAQVTGASPFGSGEVAGIESVRIDGQIYFFGFSYGGDLVVSPLHADAESMATYAAAHLRQRDGRKDQAFWLTQAQESLQESGLSDRAGTMLDLHRLRRDLAGLRRDRATVRALPGLEVPSHLIYLLEANCAWPAEEWPAGLAASAKRLGLDLDDTSGWLEGATAILAGDVAIPRGANFSDAASVYLWYLDRLLLHQRHDWSKELKLGDAEWHG